MQTIAVIDDDAYIGDLLEELLTREGYAVLRAYSGTEALLLLDRRRPDLVLLDLMLPGLSGEEVLPKLRGIPVIVLSARADAADKVNLLRAGAADYVTKPFDADELLARVAARLRAPEERTTLSFGSLTLDTTSRQACAGGVPLRLTRTEYAILHALLRSPGRVLAKSVLLDRVAEDTPDCAESSLKVHVSNLRRKLREADGKDHIESVWGIGFRLRDE